MHRLLSKLKPEANESRRGHEPPPRPSGRGNGVPAPRGRRSLNEAVHKLHR
jgi:hypothetical protein